MDLTDEGNEIKVLYTQTAQIGCPWNVAPRYRARNRGDQFGIEGDKRDFMPLGLTSAVVSSHGGGKDGLSGNDFGGISCSSIGKPS